MNTSSPSKTPWHYYSIALVSAALCGLNCFIIAWNFMVIHTGIIPALICSTASLLLNFSLYLRDGAEKMATFWQGIQERPWQVLQQSWIELCAGICIGFLTYQAYSTQLALLPQSIAIFTPVLAITWGMSIANALANFVLFSDTSPIKPHHHKSSHNNSWRQTLSSFWNPIQQNYQRFQRKTLLVQCQNTLSFGFALTQSIAYTYLNYSCTLLLLQHSIGRTMASRIAGFLSGTLFLGEVSFNNRQTDQFMNSAKKPPLWYYALIAANGIANGWIALYDITFLPTALQYSIVCIGACVSFAVMHNNYETTSAFTSFFPASNHDQTKVMHSMNVFIQALSIVYFCSITTPLSTLITSSIISLNILAMGLSLEKIESSQKNTATLFSTDHARTAKSLNNDDHHDKLTRDKQQESSDEHTPLVKDPVTGQKPTW